MESTWCWWRGGKNQSHQQDPYRVTNLEPHARLEPRDDLVIEAGGIEGQGQLFRKVSHLQLHLGADFLGEERGTMKTRAQAGQGIPRNKINALMHTRKEPSAPSPPQDSATLFSTGK